MNTNKKRLMIWIAVGLLSLWAVGAVSAQRGGSRGGHWNPHGGVMLDLATIITEASGLNPTELRQELQAGKSLATIISEAGGDVAAVKAEALATLTETINQAVMDGRLTQSQADNMLSNLEAHIDTVLNNVGGFFWRGGFFSRPESGMMPGGRGGRSGDFFGGRGSGLVGRANNLLQAVATAANLTVEELRAQLIGGATLGSVLEGAGVNLNSFVDEQLAALKTRLNEQVAAGRISQAVADARLALARAELLDRLSRAPRAVPSTTPESTPEATPQANS
ncbi:MAG: hypothetical protein NZ750_01215 [Anaerolineae bacterium]|nr:hypothetical protein [Anaerolineae bacterium]MDW8173204.1 hypothetical protein [Anaerolineae bacterium]